MSGQNPEIRKVRNAARALAAPAGDPGDLLSPGDELLRFLLDSPEILPLVEFSPFAGLPGGDLPAPGRRTERPVQKAGRAPGVPPVPPRAEPPFATGRSAAAPPSRSRSVISPETRPAQPVQTVPPVFSFRRQDGKAGPVPSSPSARGTVQGAGPGTPAAKRALSLSDLLSLKSEEAGTGLGDPVGAAPRGRPGWMGGSPEAAGWPHGAAPTDALSSGMDDGPSRHGGDLPPALTVRRALESPLPAGSGGTVPFETPPTGETGSPLELLNDLADRALRRQDGTVPASVPDRIGVPTLESSTSLARTAALAMDSEVKARFLGLETGTPDAEPAPVLPASGGPALLDAETLADLVNEALVEQARRHGVDLS